MVLGMIIEVVKLQQRKDGIHFIVVPRKALRELNWGKGDFLKCEIKMINGSKCLVLSRVE